MEFSILKWFSSLKRPVKSGSNARSFWADIPERLARDAEPYAKDGLTSYHNHEFENDASFMKAYNRGITAVGEDYNWQWRVHIGLWAAYTANRLGGDFVECGVNKGFMSSAIMEFLDWDKTGKVFYLLDTFRGIETACLSSSEIEDGVAQANSDRISNEFYTTDPGSVIENFSQWKHVKIIVGAIPGTLSQIDSKSVSFVHIDMNCAAPEIEAIEYLWDRVVTGGIILLDDYAYVGYRNQKVAMDKFATARKIAIASLPTGQGLIIKN
ncbi:MAG: TylF/MycF/NovP-related O-methyltransferase [Pseudomonadota bacterium]